MIGDGENDITAGKNAWCDTALITVDENDRGQEVSVTSLYEFVERYICQEEK